jgi:NAD(P)-dependent dehydrogenase (short-subunit alcohol dehydrogenase family)
MELHEGRASADDSAGERGNRQLLVDWRNEGSKGRAAYSARKFGVIGLTRAAALDYANIGIRINAVCPGIIGNTPMAARVTKNNNPDIIKAFVAAVPIGRLGEPEEEAEAVLWLCSPGAGFMVGHAMAVDGGILA